MDEIKIPKSVKVMGHTIKIKVKELEDDDHGEFVFDDKTIYLSNDPEKQNDQWPTLLHELIHSALTIGGVSEVLGPGVEESICRCLENLAPILALRPKK
jgi:hypothetical protein